MAGMLQAMVSATTRTTTPGAIGTVEIAADRKTTSPTAQSASASTALTCPLATTVWNPSTARATNQTGWVRDQLGLLWWSRINPTHSLHACFGLVDDTFPLGDGFCDDKNNNAGCDWDGGDCCDGDLTYCTDCECLDCALPCGFCRICLQFAHIIMIGRTRVAARVYVVSLSHDRHGNVLHAVRQAQLVGRWYL